jgi:hypothetical protein
MLDHWNSVENGQPDPYVGSLVQRREWPTSLGPSAEFSVAMPLARKQFITIKVPLLDGICHVLMGNNNNPTTALNQFIFHSRFGPSSTLTYQSASQGMVTAH